MNALVRRLALAALVIGLSVAGTTAYAQSGTGPIPRLISYQGLLTWPDGRPLPDSTYTLVLRVYDADQGGNLVYEEPQVVYIQKGLFNVTVGITTPLKDVNFEQPLWLETAILGSSPFSPRTRMTVVPYAIRSERAGAAGGLEPGAFGAVTSLNGKQGDLIVKGTQGISISESGDTIIIDGTAVAGIKEVRSDDGSIEVKNPNGPIVTVNVNQGGITTDKLADGAVTGDKIKDSTITADKLAGDVIPESLPPSGPAGGDLTGTYPDPLIRTGAVTTPKLADGAVTTPKLGDNSVSTPKLQDGAVTNPKLGDASVSTPKVQDGAITTPKLSNTGVVPGTYGTSTAIPQVTVDEKGRVTSIQMISPIGSSPSGAAGGDLTGTYPAPFIAQTSGAGDRIVGAIQQSTSPLINTPGNIVRLDLLNRLPRVDGSLLYNLPASSFTGILPVENGGTGSGTPLNNNRVMVSSGNKIVEFAPLMPGQVMIGGGAGVMPTGATLTPGAGIAIANAPGSITISSTSAMVDPGTLNDQTLRWDAASNKWMANSNLLASSTGNVTANGNIDVKGNATLASNGGANTQIGNASGNNNIIGNNNSILGNTVINNTGTGQTTIGNTGVGTHGVTLNASTNGFIRMFGVDAAAPTNQWLQIDNAGIVSTTDPVLMALEGVQFQNGAFRLGGATAFVNPLTSTRWINVNNQALNVTRNGGLQTMAQFDGLNNSVVVNSNAIVNATPGSFNTTIGASGNTTDLKSNTINIGKGLYPTTVGIGTPGNTTTTIAGQVNVNGNPQTAASSFPNMRVQHLGGTALTTPYNTEDSQLGVVVADGSGDLRKWNASELFGGSFWQLGGNNNVNVENNILGFWETQEEGNIPLYFVTNGNWQGEITSGGDLNWYNDLIVDGSTVSIDNVPTTANKTGVVTRNGAGDLEVSNKNFVTSSGVLGNNLAVYTNGSGELTGSALSNGQLLIGRTGNTPVANTLTDGTNINITEGVGTITIATVSNPTFTNVTTDYLTVVKKTTTDTLVVTGPLTLPGLTPNRNVRTNGLGQLTVGNINLAGGVNEVTGTLPIGNGGTGTATAPTNGQLLIGNAGNYSVANLTEGLNIDIVNAAGSITIKTDTNLVVNKITSDTINSEVANITNIATIDTLVVTGPLTLPGLNPNAGIRTNAAGQLETAVLTNGQFLIGKTGDKPQVGSLVATANQTTVTNNAGSITVGTVQDINTTSSPTFNNLTLNGDLGVNGSTTLGNASGDNVAINAQSVTAPNLPNGAASDYLVTWVSPSGAIRKMTALDVIGDDVWFQGGNSNPTSTLIGTNTNHDFTVRTNGTNRVTFGATGTITQLTNSQVTFAGNVDAQNGLDVTGANFTAGSTNINPANGNTAVGGTLNVSGATALNSTLVVSNTTTLNGDALLNGTQTTIGDASTDNLTIKSSNVNADFLTAGSSTDNIVTIDAAGRLHETTPSAVMADDFWAIGGNSNPSSPIIGTLTAHGIDLTTTNVSRINIAAGGQITASSNVDATAGLDVTGANLTVGSTNINPTNGNTAVGGTLTVTGNTSLNGNTTTIGDASSDVTTLNAQMVYAPNLPAVVNQGDKLVTWDPTNKNFRIQDGGGVLGGTAWLQGGNSTITNNDLGTNTTSSLDIVTNSTPRIIVDGTTGQTTVKFNLLVDGTATVTGATTLNSTLDVNGVTTLDGATTTIGDAAGDNLVITSASVRALNLPTGSVTDKLVTYDAGTNAIRTQDASAALAGSSWLLGGNTSLITGSNNILGINYANVNPLRIFTNGVERITIASGGQVTMNTNVDATAGVDVTGGPLTVGGLNFTVDQVTGNTNILGTLGVALNATLAGSLTTIGDAAGDVLTVTSSTVNVANVPAGNSATLLIREAGAMKTSVLTAGTNMVVTPAAGTLTVSTVASPTFTTVTATNVNSTNVTATNATLTNITSSGTTSLNNTTINGTFSIAGMTPNQPVLTDGSGNLTTGQINLTTAAGDVTGTLPIANGGTGVTTVPTNGQLLIGNGTGYTVGTLTEGTNIDITNAAGSITIATDPNPTFTTVTATNVNTVNATVSGLAANSNVRTGVGGALTTGPIQLGGGATEVAGQLPTANIAPGTNGQVLTTVAGAATWAPLPANNVGNNVVLHTSAVDYNATASNYVIIVSTTGSINVNLPAASGNDGLILIIKNANVSASDKVTIDPNSTETIDGAATYQINGGGNMTRTIVAKSGNWYIIGN